MTGSISISIELVGGVAVMTGTVETWGEREQAEAAARTLPGAERVVDELLVMETPAAGPHADPTLIDPDKTPGSGLLPAPGFVPDVDPADG
jgi:hypothetical protein